jgi:hypothetical protein
MDCTSAGRDHEGELRFILKARRIIQNVADLNHIQLPPQSFERCIDQDQPVITAEPGMRVDPVNVIGAVAFQLGEWYEQFRRPMEQE